MVSNNKEKRTSKPFAYSRLSLELKKNIFPRLLRFAYVKKYCEAYINPECLIPLRDVLEMLHDTTPTLQLHR